MKKVNKRLPIYFKVVPCESNDFLCETALEEHATIKATAIGVSHVMDDLGLTYGWIHPVQNINGEWIEVSGANWGSHMLPCAFEMNGGFAIPIG